MKKRLAVALIGVAAFVGMSTTGNAWDGMCGTHEKPVPCEETTTPPPPPVVTPPPAPTPGPTATEGQPVDAVKPPAASSVTVVPPAPRTTPERGVRAYGRVVKDVPERTLFYPARRAPYVMTWTVTNTGGRPTTYVLSDVLPANTYGFMRDGSRGARVLGGRVTLQPHASFTFHKRFYHDIGAVNQFRTNCVILRAKGGRYLDRSCDTLYEG